MKNLLGNIIALIIVLALVACTATPSTPPATPTRIPQPPTLTPLPTQTNTPQPTATATTPPTATIVPVAGYYINGNEISRVGSSVSVVIPGQVPTKLSQNADGTVTAFDANNNIIAEEADNEWAMPSLNRDCSDPAVIRQVTLIDPAVDPAWFSQTKTFWMGDGITNQPLDKLYPMMDGAYMELNQLNYNGPWTLLYTLESQLDGFAFCRMQGVVYLVVYAAPIPGSSIDHQFPFVVGYLDPTGKYIETTRVASIVLTNTDVKPGENNQIYASPTNDLVNEFVDAQHAVAFFRSFIGTGNHVAIRFVVGTEPAGIDALGNASATNLNFSEFANQALMVLLNQYPVKHPVIDWKLFEQTHSINFDAKNYWPKFFTDEVGTPGTFATYIVTTDPLPQ